MLRRHVTSHVLMCHRASTPSTTLCARCVLPLSAPAWTQRRFQAGGTGGNPGTRTGNAIYDPTQEPDVAVKPIDQQVAEQRDSKLYTMQQYMDKMESDQRAGRKILDKIDEATTSPSWLLWGLLFIGVSVGYTIMCVRIRREKVRFDPKMRALKTIDQPGGPSIGGPFTLKDVNGKVWTEKDFHGKWIYIYFGFTNCPDVCPDEMSKMSRMITKLDKKVGRDYWQPIFISIDPYRDTPEIIQEYLDGFHPRILGLTGASEEVERAAREFRVYYAVPDESEGKDDYLIDHSIIMYLMDPTGKFCDYTTKEFSWYESYIKLLKRMTDFEKDPPEGHTVNERVRDCMSMSAEVFHRVQSKKKGKHADSDDVEVESSSE